MGQGECTAFVAAPGANLIAGRKDLIPTCNNPAGIDVRCLWLRFVGCGQGEQLVLKSLEGALSPGERGRKTLCFLLVSKHGTMKGPHPGRRKPLSHVGKIMRRETKPVINGEQVPPIAIAEASSGGEGILLPNSKAAAQTPIDQARRCNLP